ncbi:MAG: HprK-related kinase B [Desulfovibrionaceae bacterium]
MAATPPAIAPTIAATAREYLAAYPPTHTLLLSFGDLVVEVWTNSRALFERLAFYFGGFLIENRTPAVAVYALETPAIPPDRIEAPLAAREPEPGKTRVKEEWADVADGRVVRKRLTGMAFLFGAGMHLALGPCEANDNQVVNFINNRYIEYRLRQGCLLFHAAGVCRGGKGLALAGFAGMGKSTLALHAMTRGDAATTFVSNDRLMVGRAGAGLHMHGVAKMPRINPGTVLNNPALAPVISDEERTRFATLPIDELWGLEHKYDGFIDQCYGPGRFALSAHMTGLVLLNWRRGGGDMRMEPVDLRTRPDLMPAFMKQAGLFYAPEQDALAVAGDMDPGAYLDLLGDCPVFELSGGVDFHGAADRCLELLA